MSLDIQRGGPISGKIEMCCGVKVADLARNGIVYMCISVGAMSGGRALIRALSLVPTCNLHRKSV